MTGTLDTLLLLALPASGKSELRRYLDTRTPAQLAELHLRPGVQLDDYPYVHLMRRVSAELADLGSPPVFFASSGRGWLDPRDWGTLIHLINEDYAALTRSRPVPAEAADTLLRRFDAARRAVGAPAPFESLNAGLRSRLCAAIEEEATQLGVVEPVDLAAHTVVIEFARGGPEGARMPLDPPHGYGYSLSRLSPSILESAAILYVWVEPAESRRRNRERAKPGREADASILHHGVPEAVMREEYGTDDMKWLIEHGGRPGTVAVPAHGHTFHLPVVRFDNRVDRTSFLRADPGEWDDQLLATLWSSLVDAFGRLAALRAEQTAG
ncbi:MAG: hypothetical protein OEP52_10395 [Acidimicrobiia bacterium]|nr:hypothetical protein [Acidimicrobiia bacterium]